MDFVGTCVGTYLVVSCVWNAFVILGGGLGDHFKCKMLFRVLVMDYDVKICLSVGILLLQGGV